MHFFTHAASGALPLCFAPHIESLIYPETLAELISAASAGTVESAKTTKNAFMLPPCDRIEKQPPMELYAPARILASPIRESGLTALKRRVESPPWSDSAWPRQILPEVPQSSSNTRRRPAPPSLPRRLFSPAFWALH